jgi:DNA-3-methyladenine glycosylase II
VAQAGPYALAARATTPYEALVSAVAGQQLHARAVEAIMGRFRALYPGTAFPPPTLVLATEDATLRGCGFSFSKIACIRDIAAKTLDGTVPGRAEAEALDDATLIARLTSLRGVGRWTVEMLLIFTLGRPDVLPVDDFAIREGWRLLTGADTQPKPKALAEIGQRWAPYRTTAAWYLWRAADAGKGKQGQGALPPGPPPGR